MIRMFQLSKRTTCLYHFLIEPLYLFLKQFIRIRPAVAVLGFSLCVNAFDDIHRRFAGFLIGGFRYKFRFAKTICIIYKLCHFQILSFEFKMYLPKSLNVFIKIDKSYNKNAADICGIYNFNYLFKIYF